MKHIHSLITFFSALSLSVLASTERGPDTYVKVLFSDGEVIYYNFGECYPYQLDNGRGATAEFAQWYQNTDCQSYEKFDCSGEKINDLPVPGGTPLVNVADFVQLIGGNSANCTKLQIL